MFCNKCGNKMSGNAAFCNKCGTKHNISTVSKENEQSSNLQKKYIPNNAQNIAMNETTSKNIIKWCIFCQNLNKKTAKT